MNEALIPRKRPIGSQLATGVSTPSLYKSTLNTHSGYVASSTNLWIGSVVNELPEEFMDFSVVDNDVLIREEHEEHLVSPTPSTLSFTSIDNARSDVDTSNGTTNGSEDVNSDGVIDEADFFEGPNSFTRDSIMSKLAWGRLTPTISSIGHMQIYNEVTDTARNPMYISRANSPASFHHDYVPKELMKSLSKTDSFANMTTSRDDGSTPATTIRNPTIRNTFIIGKIQTSFDIRNYIDFHEIIAYSSGRTNSTLKISVLARNPSETNEGNAVHSLSVHDKFVEIDLHSRIKNIKIPTLSRLYTRYSDLISVLTDRSLVMIKIKSIDNQNCTIKYEMMEHLDFTKFGDYPFADVAFNPMDPQQFALVDTKGNWTIGTMPSQLKRSTKLQLNLNNRGTIYDPEAFSNQKYITWSTDNSRILVVDETKIVELDLTEMVQTEIVQAKTWSTLLDFVELTEDFKVLLTSMEIVIIYLDREKNEVSRLLSWKHDLDPLDHTYRMFIQEVSLQGRSLYFVYCCSKNHNMMYLKGFTLDTNTHSLQALQGSTVIEVPEMPNGIQGLEFSEEVIDEVDTDYHVLITIFAREHDTGIVKKFTLSNSNNSGVTSEDLIRNIDNRIPENPLDLTNIPLEVQYFQHDTTNRLLKKISQMKNLSDEQDIRTLERYGYYLSESMNKFIQATPVDDKSNGGLLANLFTPPESFGDIEEYSSFLSQFFEHYQNENVTFTDLKSIFKWFIKDDAPNIDIFYNKLHQCWALADENAEIYTKEVVKQIVQSSLNYTKTDSYKGKVDVLYEALDEKSKELISEWGNDDLDDDFLESQSTVPQSSQPQFSLNSQSQIPTIRSSQNRVEKKKSRASTYTKKSFANVTAQERDLLSQNTLPSSMAPAFSLMGAPATSTQHSQNMSFGSSQLSNSQRTKKKKKKRVGGFT